MILTVASDYPSEKNMYTNGFVHARVKGYINDGIDSEVYVLNRSKKPRDYVIEGVTVKGGSGERLVEYVNGNKDITGVCFHFLDIRMLKALMNFRKDINVVIFVHGNEALWWHERLFPERFNGLVRTLKFFKYILTNTAGIMYIRGKINKIGENTNIVCVSEWMKNVAVKNWKIDEKKIAVHVIPNIVNEKIFPYKPKTPDKRYKLLFIRKFTGGKYAIDIAMDTIRELMKYPEGEKLEITIVGDGWLYEKYISRVREYKNIKFIRKFLPHAQIAEEHEKNGIFICPTRQDAQGVSMCEAMSSGLVPISSPNTAIPEFLPVEYNLAFDTAEESAKRIIELIRNEEEFLELSEKVSSFIREKCCIEKTTGLEIELMRSMNNGGKN